MGKGWITLNREIQEHWIWSNHEYAYAWIDLLLMVNHENKKVMIDNVPVLIKRGQVLTSICKLSTRWGWSRARVYRFIDLLISDGMLNKNSTSHYTMLTIVNYGKYQDARNSNDTPKKTTRKSTADTPDDTQTTMNNNYINNDKQDSSPISDETAPVEEEGDFDGMTPEEWWEALERGEVHADWE